MNPGFLASFFFILLAEMGDKTQLVALSFAAKYRPANVLAGVFLGTLICHWLSVFIGQNLSVIIPFHYLKIVIGLSFVGFGVWTLKGDSYDGQQGRDGVKFNPVITVAIAFFLAELGDKTQLATISLAAEYQSFLGVWLGSTLGMVAADGLAIIIGVLAGRKLPEKTIKYLAASIFVVFGLLIVLEAILKN